MYMYIVLQSSLIQLATEMVTLHKILTGHNSLHAACLWVILYLYLMLTWGWKATAKMPQFMIKMQ